MIFYSLCLPFYRVAFSCFRMNEIWSILQQQMNYFDNMNVWCVRMYAWERERERERERGREWKREGREKEKEAWHIFVVNMVFYISCFPFYHVVLNCFRINQKWYVCSSFNLFSKFVNFLGVKIRKFINFLEFLVNLQILWVKQWFCKFTD